MPTHSQLEESDLDLIVSGTRDAITMIEGFAREMSEENMLQAILFAPQADRHDHRHDRGAAQQGRPGRKELPAAGAAEPAVEDVLQASYYDEFRERKQTTGKQARADAIKELREKIVAEFLPEDRRAAVHARPGGRRLRRPWRSRSSAT